MADYTLTAKINGDANGFTRAFQCANQTLAELSSKTKAVGEKVSEFGKRIGGIGDKLTSKITTPALGAATALGSIALVKGFNRLTGIDNAKAKLKGLGHDADSVTEIMNSALESVRGTSYGMDAAATTAASAVAAGIKPGKDLTRYLSLTADAASIAGASMSEMGSIINQVQTSQVAYTDNLNQLSDRGIPIYQWLGEEAGVAASEVKELASKGKISSEMFLSAIEKNIGGAAKTMGESSFTAAISNIGASFSRIGANFLDAGGKGGGFFSTLKPMLTDFNNRLGTVESKAAELGVKFGEAFNAGINKVKEIKGMFDGLSPSVQGVILKVAGIGAAVAVGIGPALKMAGFLTTGFGNLITIFSALISPIGLVIAAIVTLTATFGYFMATNETFRSNVISSFQSVVSYVQGFVERMKVLFESMYDVVFGSMGVKDNADLLISMGFDPDIANRLMSITSKIGGIITSFWDIWFGSMSVKDNVDFMQLLGISESTATRVGNIATTIQTLVTGSIDVIKGTISSMSGVFSSVMGTLGGIIGSLGTIFSSVWQVIQTFFTSLVGGFQLAGGVGSGFGIQILSLFLGLNPIVKMAITLFQSFGPQIAGAFQQIVAMVLPVVANLGTALGQLASAVIPLIMQAVSTLIPVIIQMGMTMMTIISAVLPVLINLFNQLFPIIMQVVMVVIDLAAQFMPLVAVIISSLLPVIQNLILAFMNIVQSVAPAFIAIIQLIIGVIQAMIPIIMSIITVVVHVFAGIVSTVSPIVAFIAGIISAVMGVISPIVTFIAGIISSIIATIRPIIVTVTGIFNTVFSVISGIWRNIMTFIGSAINKISSIINGISSTVSKVFSSVFSTISRIMDRVSSKVSGVFSAIQGAWSGLTSFVSGVFSGISGSVQSLVSQVKGFVNGVIGGINSAISIINKVPGVSISKIPYLARGTDDWQGGFAYMNEGGRGELVNLPNGSQVIPHDVSMRYAREAARSTDESGIRYVSNSDERNQSTTLENVQAVINIGGYEARGVINFITKEQSKEKKRDSRRFRG
jgi:tape measure domain-containing protein